MMRSLEKLIPRRGDVTPEMIARAEQHVLERGRSLDALTAFTEVLLSAYQRGRMPEAARESFKQAVRRLYQGADREEVVTPLSIRLSQPQLEASLARTERLVKKHEAEIDRLRGAFDGTVREIDRLEETAESLVLKQRRLLAQIGQAKDRSRTASVFSGVAGLVPGLKLANVAWLIPGAGPLALLALGFGGYKAYENWQRAEELTREMKTVEGKIAGASAQLDTLRRSRAVFDANIDTLRDGLDSLVSVEKKYRARLAEPAPVTPGEELLAIARRLRTTESLAFNLKQQCGVLKAMLEHAEGVRDQLPELVRALEKDVESATRAVKEAEADFLSSVLATVLGAAKVKGVTATVIREAVLLAGVGPEVTVAAKIKQVLGQLGVAEAKQPELVKSASELIAGIDKLTADRAQILSPEHDRKLEKLTEPQRFLVDVALSRLNTKIDPAVLIDVASRVKVGDEEARRIAAMIAGRSSATEVREAVAALG